MGSNIKPISAKEWVQLGGAILGALALGLVVLLVVNQIQSNKQAIEKGCVLINNVVIKSQRGSARPDSSTAILVKTILENASPERRAQFAAALKRETNRSNPLLVPCAAVADDPEQIEAIPITTTPGQTTTTP